MFVEVFYISWEGIRDYNYNVVFLLVEDIKIKKMSKVGGLSMEMNEILK